MTSSFQTRKWVLLTCAAITGLMAVTIPADAETPKPLSLRGEIDLDGNGKSVLLLRSNKAQMQVGRLVGNKLQFSTLADPGLNFKLAGVSDFDGDGKSDLVLVNTTTPERGDVRAWTNFSPSGDKLLRPVKHVWEVQAVGDLDGDGKGDLVWRYVVSDSPDTGVSYIWFSDGAGVGQVRKRGGAPLDWTLLGARDLNGDGAADMVYVSPDGAIRVLMATANRTCANYGAGSVPAGFTAMALADFTGGKRGDILLQNLATGAVQVLALDATGIQLPPPSANPDNPNASCTGTAGATIGTRILPMPGLNPTSTNNPQFFAAGDFDGDGISDILWAQDWGELVMWSMRPNGGIPAINYQAGIPPVGFAPFNAVSKQSPYPMKIVSPATRAAARLLTQATFGATSAEIDRVAAIGAQSYLNEQFALPQKLYVPMVRNDPDYRVEYWNIVSGAMWKQIFEGNDQLRQRVAYALSQILVISLENNRIQDFTCGAAAYLDILGKHAFGNFRDLLKDVTLSTAMGEYLDMKQNAKIDNVGGSRPNENYAREMLQLFSIGTVMLNQDGSVQFANGKPIDTYDEVIVQELARALTGWTYSKQDQTKSWRWLFPDTPFPGDAALTPEQLTMSCDVWASPMEPWRTNYRANDNKRDIVGTPHDTFPKSLLKYPGSTNRKQELPAGQTPEKDLDDAIENIFYHPNVGPFIGELLIQRLVTSNPSGAYVSRVAAAFNDNGAGVRGDMKSVIRAILLDSEATASIGNQSSSFGKLREPVLRFTQAHRAFSAKTGNGSYSNIGNLSGSQQLGQSLLRAPSVFNFYSPEFAPSGLVAKSGLVGPEFEITSSATLAGFAEFSRWNMTNGFGNWETDKSKWLKPHYDPYLALASNPGALVDALNVVMLSGAMSYSFRTAVVDAVSKVWYMGGNEDRNLERVRMALWLILNSPEYSIQR
jgi:uncharacterized protein (DUF1800 family)